MRSAFIVTILFLILGTAFPVRGQSPAADVPVDQQRAQRLSDTPLDDKDVQYEFDMGAEGAGIAVTALGPDKEIGEHVGWRVHQLAMDAARCDFTAPEFGNVALSAEAQALCIPRPKLRVASHSLLNGFRFEIGTSSPALIPKIQQLVGRSLSAIPKA